MGDLSADDPPDPSTAERGGANATGAASSLFGGGGGDRDRDPPSAAAAGPYSNYVKERLVRTDGRIDWGIYNVCFLEHCVSVFRGVRAVRCVRLRSLICSVNVFDQNLFDHSNNAGGIGPGVQAEGEGAGHDAGREAQGEAARGAAGQGAPERASAYFLCSPAPDPRA